MRLLALIALLLSGCAVDLLDGDIEDPQNCCLKLSACAILECAAELTEPGYVNEVWCGSPVSDVVAKRSYGGEFFGTIDGEKPVCEGMKEW